MYLTQISDGLARFFQECSSHNIPSRQNHISSTSFRSAAFSPNDFREQQFVIFAEKASPKNLLSQTQMKFADLDDFSTEDPSCSSDSDCMATIQLTINESTQKNLFNVQYDRQFIFTSIIL